MSQLSNGIGTTTPPLAARLRRISPYFTALKGVWIIVIISAVVGALTEPMIPALLKPLLDKGFQKGELEVWMIPTALLLLFAVRGLAGYMAQIGLTKITNDGLAKFRTDIFEKLLYGKVDLFAENSSSALANTIVYEAQNGALMLVNSILSLTRNGLTLLALTGYLFFLNWKLTLIVAAIFPSVAFVMRLLTKRLHKITKSTQDATDELAYVVEENVLAHRDVRINSAQKSQAQRFDRLSEALKRLALKSTVAGAAMTPLTQMLAAVALSAVISVALIQSSSEGATVGDFVAFVTAMLMIIAPIRQLSEISSPMTRGIAALERGLDFMDNTQAENEGFFEVKRADGHIIFSDVSTQYTDKATNAVDHVNLEIFPGEIIALVGASGSGKSSLVNMLPRFVDITSGSISLDGQDIRTWKLDSLRSQYSIVSQNVVMLNDTISGNVALGQEIDKERVLDCLHSANLGDLIESLEHGVDTVVGHNAMQMSGGQRQRLAIARALYKNAPILILDEATSALDTKSEQVIQESLNNLMKDRTTIIIAHRLSTVKHANRIVVMDAGKVAEIGTHEDLMALGGLYTKLYKLGFNWVQK